MLACIASFPYLAASLETAKVRENEDEAVGVGECLLSTGKMLSAGLETTVAGCRVLSSTWEIYLRKQINGFPFWFHVLRHRESSLGQPLPELSLAQRSLGILL